MLVRVILMIPLLALLCIGWFFLILAGGPKFFLPPMNYGLKISVTMAIDGRLQTFEQGVQCSVKDVRGSIVNRAWDIDTRWEQPFFPRSNGRAVLISRMEPCLWREEAPVPGKRYIVYTRDPVAPGRERVAAAKPTQGAQRPQVQNPVPHSFSQIAGGLPRLADTAQVDELEGELLVIYGQVVQFESAQNGGRLRIAPLDAFDGAARDGIELKSLTLEIVEAPMVQGLTSTIPVLGRAATTAGLPENATLDAIRQFNTATTYYDVTASLHGFKQEDGCHTRQGREWAVAAEPDCPRGREGYLAISVSPDGRTIEVDTNSMTNYSVSAGIDAAAAVASGAGRFPAAGERGDEWYAWRPRVCVDGNCFNVSEDSEHTTLVSDTRLEFIKLNFNRRRLADLVDERP